MKIRKMKQGQEPLYDNYYKIFRNGSWVLNESIRQKSPKFAGRLQDLQDTTAYLRDIDEELMPDALKELAKVEKQIENYYQERINQGFHVNKDEMPSCCNGQYLKALAIIDVLNEERHEVNILVEVYSKETAKKREYPLLTFGLREAGKLMGGVLAYIDGQKVSVNNAGILIIDDEASPYDGLAVSDYREFAKAWVAKEQHKIELAREAYRKEVKEKGQSNIRIDKHGYTLNELPVFPYWYDNHKTGQKARKKRTLTVEVDNE